MTSMSNRSRQIAIGLAVAAVAIGVIVMIVARGGGPQAGGPLTFGQRTDIHTPLNVGVAATYGQLIAHNQGTKTIVIDSINLDPDGPVDGLTIDHVLLYAIPVTGGDLVGTSSTWAPPRTAVDASGASIPPTVGGSALGSQVLVGVTASSAGIFKFKSVTVHYHTGSTRYLLSIPQVVWFCAGATTC